MNNPNIDQCLAEFRFVPSDDFYEVDFQCRLRKQHAGQHTAEITDFGKKNVLAEIRWESTIVELNNDGYARAVHETW